MLSYITASHTDACSSMQPGVECVVVLAGFHNLWLGLGSENWPDDCGVPKIRGTRNEIKFIWNSSHRHLRVDGLEIQIGIASMRNLKDDTPQCNWTSRLPLRKNLSNSAMPHVTRSHKLFGPWPIIDLCCWVTSHAFLLSQNASPREVRLKNPHDSPWELRYTVFVVFTTTVRLRT